MTNPLHITLAQINPIVGDLAYNREKILKRAREASSADLVVFPELALCGYPPEDLVLKPFFLDKIEQNLQELVVESKELAPWLLIGAPLREGSAIYNAAYLIGEGKIQAVVRKRHLPNYGVFDEARIFRPARVAEPVVFQGHKLGVLICEDMWHTDVAMELKEKGAELLIVVNASPFEISKHDNRLDVARARTRETSLPLIYVNQAGGQDELVFDGASFILNEAGDLILQAEEFVEDIHETVWEKRNDTSHWLCTTDTIIPTHKGPEAIYQAAMIGLRDYVTKNGFSGVLIGLSGGIDSALTAAIAVDALGREAVRGVAMPSRYTSKASLEDAQELAENLQIPLETIPIEPAVESFGNILSSHLPPDISGITFENIQSRCRGLILMALSNATGRMVLSTGNKSEMAVGYATLYGDMCGGYNALKDIYKTQVFELANWRNKRKPEHGLGFEIHVIPERTITKAPSAELRDDQTDQDSLPPYDVLDAILYGLIEKDLSIDEITDQGFDASMVREVWSMLDKAEYKRRQAPPGLKITSRFFGRDRRYPITNRFTGSKLE